MNETCCRELKVGQVVPEFKIEAYDPLKGDFREISSESLKASGKWIILFFFPAAFTFV